jgi:ADP-ribose pyrophosphatase
MPAHLHDARTRYRELLRQHPSLAANQPGGFEILLDDAEMDEIESASWKRFREQRDADPALTASTPAACSDWFRVGVVFEDSYLTILRDAVRTPDGKRTTYVRVYNRLDKGPGAAVLARNGDKFVLIRHHRHALRAFLTETPRGFSRPNENCEETAKRQLREEIQGTATSFEPLGQIHPDGGKLGDSVCAMFVDLSGTGSAERGEAITGYELVDAKELTRRIASNEITDAFTLALYAKAVARKLISPE